MPVSDMISRPTNPTQINFQDWRVSDVDYLLIGQMTETSPNNYGLQFQLFNVRSSQQLLAFRLTSDRNNLRAAAHRIADMVFEELTGIPGVFGTQIAYISEERNGDRRLYQLIVADADGENRVVIAESTQPLMSPAWSPDGRRLAYVSFEGNQSAVYVQTLRTGTRERVSMPAGPRGAPVFAPDGRRLAYVSFEGNQSAVYVQTLRTGTRERVSMRAGHNGAPVFSPDGRRLALTLSLVEGNFDVYTLDLGTQVLRRLTDHPAIDSEPAWSPDGETIYFMSDRSGAPQIYRLPSNADTRATPQRV